MPENSYVRLQASFEKKITIPQIKAKTSIIREVNTDSYWEANDILVFEKTRRELRDLMKFLVDDAEPKNGLLQISQIL